MKITDIEHIVEHSTFYLALVRVRLCIFQCAQSLGAPDFFFFHSSNTKKLRPSSMQATNNGPSTYFAYKISHLNEFFFVLIALFIVDFLWFFSCLRVVAVLSKTNEFIRIAENFVQLTDVDEDEFKKDKKKNLKNLPFQS